LGWIEGMRYDIISFLSASRATFNHDNYFDLDASGCIKTLARRKCTMNLLNCIPVTLGYHQV
jgi:hypothetical protein